MPEIFHKQHLFVSCIVSGDLAVGMSHLSLTQNKYLVPNMIPVLKFFLPAVKYDNIPREFNLLSGIPRDNVLEMALSFNRLLTMQEMEAIFTDGVHPMWGAISVYSNEEIAQNNYLAKRLVGIPLGGFREGEYKITESEFADELERLSRVPSYSSRQLKRTAAYLRDNGIRYYGVVVSGTQRNLSR